MISSDEIFFASSSRADASAFALPISLSALSCASFNMAFAESVFSFVREAEYSRASEIIFSAFSFASRTVF